MIAQIRSHTRELFKLKPRGWLHLSTEMSAELLALFKKFFGVRKAMNLQMPGLFSSYIIHGLVSPKRFRNFLLEESSWLLLDAKSIILPRLPFFSFYIKKSLRSYFGKTLRCEWARVRESTKLFLWRRTMAVDTQEKDFGRGMFIWIIFLGSFSCREVELLNWSSSTAIQKMISCFN